MHGHTETVGVVYVAVRNVTVDSLARPYRVRITNDTARGHVFSFLSATRVRPIYRLVSGSIAVRIDATWWH